MLKNVSSTRPLASSFSDTINTGCGTILSLGNMVCHRNWSSDEKSKTSTWREMTAVHFGLDLFKKFISRKSVYWFSDNQVAVHIIENGRVGWGKMSMVGQSESDDIFNSEVKAKALMITGS